MSDGGKKGARQAQLLESLATRRHMTLTEIAHHFAIGAQTARRDVMELESAGRLRRIHGGAMIADAAAAAGDLRARRIRNAAAKERIARSVAALVEDRSAIFLDTGTTCEAIARALTARRGLRVVTYSLRAAAFLREATDFTIAIPGGFARPVDGAVFSENTAAFIADFKFDLAILSVSGVDPDGDLTDDDAGEVEAVRAAMGRARRILLAVDASKFDYRGLVRLGALSDVDVMVSEVAPPPGIAAAAPGVTLVRADR